MLALAGVVAEVILGGALGILATLYGRVRALVSAINLTLLAIPIFVLGLLLLLVFGFQLSIAPVTGGAGPAQLVLPALTLGLIGAPWYAQIVADQMQDSLASSVRQDRGVEGPVRLLHPAPARAAERAVPGHHDDRP